MIDHLSIGATDIGRARTFYDGTLGALGYQCLSAEASALGYGRDAIAFWVLASSVAVPTNQASGLHVCFFAPGYHAAFVVDRDGYRVEAHCAITG